MFGMDSRRADGREGVCKTCRNLARQHRASHSAKMKPKIIKAGFISKPITEKENIEKTIQDNVDLMEEMKKKHNSYFCISSHPHLNGYALQLQNPRFHKEGKDLRSILQEALALPSAPEAI